MTCRFERLVVLLYCGQTLSFGFGEHSVILFEIEVFRGSFVTGGGRRPLMFAVCVWRGGRRDASHS